MEQHDNPYNLFPREYFVVNMKHLHPGNSTRKERENSKYFSCLHVFRRTSPHTVDGNNPIYVTAKCSGNDMPSRSQARAVLRMKARAIAIDRGWIQA